MQTTTTIPFNINDTVRVKLTDHGRATHAMRHVIFNLTNKLDLEYVKPVEDAEGWSEWQLWVLMRAFGQDLFMGNLQPPFETGIQLVRQGD